VLLLRSLLGLEPDLRNGIVVLDPVLPVGSSELRLEGLNLGGHRVTVEVARGTVHIAGLDPGIAVAPRG
jgi:hypothetical protein